jgi:hypothetical protein
MFSECWKWVFEMLCISSKFLKTASRPVTCNPDAAHSASAHPAFDRPAANLSVLIKLLLTVSTLLIPLPYCRLMLSINADPANFTVTLSS